MDRVKYYWDFNFKILKLAKNNLFSPIKILRGLPFTAYPIYLKIHEKIFSNRHPISCRQSQRADSVHEGSDSKLGSGVHTSELSDATAPV